MDDSEWNILYNNAKPCTIVHTWYVNRVYAQPYYVLRKTKFYAAVKKGVCAPSYVIPKLYLNL